jgi:hypothetical protein
MLSEDEVRRMEEGRRQGLAGPVLMTWVDRLLEERRELLAQLQHIRQRLRQAAGYLDGLFKRPAERPSRDRTHRTGT